MEVNIDSIQPSPFQPRLVFDQDDLRGEIEKDGLLNALVVRKRGKLYELIDGERRLRVLKNLGWKRVPVRVVRVDDAKARLNVYKLNKIRENYTIEEEARYFKKLAEKDMTPMEISKQLNVDFRWVLAHLNAFQFPKTIQKAVWNKHISISHLMALEKVINRNIKEAKLFLNQILERRLTVAETRRIAKKRAWELRAQVDNMRIKAAEKILPAIAPKLPKLETPEEYEEAAKALKQKAREMRKGTTTSQEILEKVGQIKPVEEDIEEVSLQTVKSLREKIEGLEKERESLLEKKSFLTEALSFNCPHCNQSCIVYREADSYWVE
ncbi:MAG: ParB/RepB/Spo0J family partition protein [Candidatus Bathyarchaeota archaeon]|nr:MAG: ParB/RepB/Spo0J family partition protein [Candidatus Bathyarchaeota archaeon]